MMTGRLRPTRSYIIWFTQRVGSTWLAQALEDTGVAGRPREWLNAPLDVDATTQRDRLWNQATTANGVMGIKYGITPKLHAEVTALFAGFGADERSAWGAVFPSSKHVFMTRRNKVRLAVSWWRAISSSEWHRPTRDDTAVGLTTLASVPDLIDKYDANALDHLLAEVSLREAVIQDVFDRWRVVPHTIVYEDLVADYDGTFARLMAFLELPAIPAPPAAFEPIADTVSACWYERYMAEPLTTRRR